MSQCRTSMPENIQILNLKNIYKKKKITSQRNRNAEVSAIVTMSRPLDGIKLFFLSDLYVKRSHGKTGQNLRELEPPYKRETLQARWKGSFVE